VTRVATLRFQSFEILAGIDVIVGELLPERDDHKLFAIELFTSVTFRVPTILDHFRQCLHDNLVLCHRKIPLMSSGVITKITWLALLHGPSSPDLQPGYQSTFEKRVKTKEILQ
jgi:hypothetical protein